MFAISGEIVKASLYINTSAPFFQPPLVTHLFLSALKMSMMDAHVMIYKKASATSFLLSDCEGSLTSSDPKDQAKDCQYTSKDTNTRILCWTVLKLSQQARGHLSFLLSLLNLLMCVFLPGLMWQGLDVWIDVIREFKLYHVKVFPQ